MASPAHRSGLLLLLLLLVAGGADARIVSGRTVTVAPFVAVFERFGFEIGRASCRERG